MEFERFVNFARRGQHGAASGGERRCAELAAAMLEAAPELDPALIREAAKFMAYASMNYSKAEELLEGGRAL